MKDVLVIYHANCPDGFGSAHLVYNFFKEHEPQRKIDFFPGKYENDPPYDLIKGKNVYLVDFSYKLGILKNIAEIANKVIILDHHVSAFENLKPTLFKKTNEKIKTYNIDGLKNVKYYYSKEHSGVGIVWNYFYNTPNMPFLYECIQDRDLWKWKIKDSKEILKGLDTYPFDFKIWNNLIGEYEALKKMGINIIRYEERLMNEIIESNKMIIDTKWGKVPAINCPHYFSSEIGHIMSKGYPFALMFQINKDGINCSLRSQKKGEDVSKICSEFGGGGHRNAGGFSIDYKIEELFKRLKNNWETSY